MRLRSLATLALAGIAGASSLAVAQPVEDNAILYCTASSSDFRIASAADKPPAQAYQTKQGFNASTLIGFDLKTERRTGSQTKHLQCGDIVIDVTGGFYNSNPNGELGAAEDFTKLAISRRANKIEVSLLEDSCSDAPIPRAQAVWGDHPVQAIEGHRVGGSYQVTLFKTACDTSKTYTQVLTWPSN